MLTSDFHYDLPKELIAQTPLTDRASSRLLVYDRTTREVGDHVFQDLPAFLRPGDVIVRNNTRVIPARLYGKREDTGGAMEFLLLKRLSGDEWEAIVKPGRRARTGLTFTVTDELSVTILKCMSDGGRILRLNYRGIFEEVLDRAGHMPLPPYITERLTDQERYQTVYAKERGSAAAPTAGLHFTPELFMELKQNGIEIADILLHVGLGTFRPVSSAIVEEHKMHEEYYEISEQTADIVNTAKREGRRVIAVGTTSCRTLESAVDENGMLQAKRGWTNIFITPGYRFKMIDALITNFHLPESTLLMLVSAFTSREEMLAVYRHAVENRYRFFSFGDAMLIL